MPNIVREKLKDMAAKILPYPAKGTPLITQKQASTTSATAEKTLKKSPMNDTQIKGVALYAKILFPAEVTVFSNEIPSHFDLPAYL